jgi:hypothetical protein
MRFARLSGGSVQPPGDLQVSGNAPPLPFTGLPGYGLLFEDIATYSTYLKGNTPWLTKSDQGSPILPQGSIRENPDHENWSITVAGRSTPNERKIKATV